DVMEVEGVDVNVLNESRTKDAFLASFIKSILDGNSLKESARFGIAVSAVVAQKESMPKLEEITKIMRGDEGNA
ncbi:MAG: PfkB family carbohydrate kinase, partial [Candidatus Jordarchaeales archaeon]